METPTNELYAISKINEPKFKLERNRIYKLSLFETQFKLHIQNPRYISTSNSYYEVELNMIDSFEPLLEPDKVIQYIQSELNLSTEDIFKARGANDEDKAYPDMIYHIKMNDDLITFKMMYINCAYSEFYVKIRSNDETHKHSYGDVLTKDAIKYLCDFLKFTCSR